MVYIQIDSVKEFDLDPLLNKYDYVKGVYISITSESDPSFEHMSPQYHSTGSRTPCSTIHYAESLFIAHNPIHPLRLKFQLRFDEGGEDSLIGDADLLFVDKEVVSGLQLRDIDNTLVGILCLKIR